MNSCEGADSHIEEVIRSLERRAGEFFPGASLVAVYSHKSRKIEYIPIHHALSSTFGHAIDYGSGVFEGASALVNERTGIPNVVLLEARNHRMYHRSLPARGYESPVSEKDFVGAILELIRLNGPALFRHPDGKTPGLVRAYIRPTVYPSSLSGYGISLRRNYPIDAAIVSWAWPDYLDPTLSKRGGTCAITGQQRLFPITGKHPSNYGAAVKDGTLARSLGADELIYLAPYLIDQSGRLYWNDPNNIRAKLVDGVISDGPGEECVALTADQKTLIYAPMRVNRLGGTVLGYIIDHMAKNLGLITREADITLHDLRAGKYAGLAMVGNAVKVTPIRQVNLFDDGVLVDSICLFKEGDVPENLANLSYRWDLETRGLIDPSHPSLLTPVY